MKLSEMLKCLNISKWSAVWAFLTDGWAGLAKNICEAFTKLLRKADAGKLKEYAEFTAKVALFIRGGIETFCVDAGVRAAGMKTADAIAELAEHLKDGEYSTDEFDRDIDNIEACVDAWKKVCDEDDGK